MFNVVKRVLLLRTLKRYAQKVDFSKVSPKDVLEVLEQVSESGVCHPYTEDKLLHVSEMVEEYLLEIWENAAEQSNATPFGKRRWLKVMAMCNSLLCALIPEDARDSTLIYIDAQKAA